MKKYLGKLDLWLLTLMIIYSILGSVMIYSASSILTVLSLGVASNYFFIRQAIFLIVSFIVGFLIVLKVPTSKYRYIIYPLLIGIIAALIGLYFFGEEHNGAVGWYDLGLFSLQPSEFAKSALIIFIGVYYHHLIKIKEQNIIKYLIPLLVGIIIAVLVLMQPDMGGAAIIGLLLLCVFFSIPMNKYIKKKTNKIVMGSIIIGIIGIIIIGPKVISTYQLNRLNFRNPCTRYSEITGYQVCNGFIAIKNGGLTGLGFGNSTQKYLYLPEAHTDFIFPIIVEELGLIVGIAVLFGYFAMLFRIFIIAKNATVTRNSIIAYGILVYLTLHILINILGVLALIPLTGVPLPLLSYGGSFNMNVVIMLFVCQRISIENATDKSRRMIKNL